jgi:hypothetical protein
MDFENDVLPVMVRYGRKVFGTDDERFSIALVLCWWLFSNRREDHPPRVYARVACAHAMHGRDLPGVRSGKSQDAYRLTQWQGGGMGMVTDRRPGPAEEAEMREEMRNFLAVCNDQERLVAETLIGDHGATVAHLADLIGKSKGRVSQIRRALAERYAD